MLPTDKTGIDYSGWSVTMFDGDRKIDKLLDAQGWKGFGVYFFLCQLAYKMNGYYLEWRYDDCASTARKMGGYMGADTVEATVKLCLQVGLFDQKLFDGWSVLTSRGIQRRYWQIAGRRAYPLNKALWLLSPEETEGLDKCARFEDFPPEMFRNSAENDDFQNTSSPKVKQNKINKNNIYNNIYYKNNKNNIYTQARKRECVDEDKDIDEDDGYERFLAAWPKISGRPEANYFAYMRALDSGATLEEMLTALEWQRELPGWKQNGGQFIPSPEKWLKNRGWTQKKPEVQEHDGSGSGASKPAWGTYAGKLKNDLED